MLPLKQVHYQYKLAILGDSGVGKTSLIQRHIFGQFHEQSSPTMGINIISTTYSVQELSTQCLVGLDIWEFGGQKELLPIWGQYLQNVHGALLLFDLTAPSTLDSLQFWKNLVLQYAKAIPMHIIGTKRDLWVKTNLFDDVFLVLMQRQLNIWTYTESSAKSGLNIEDVFQNIIQEILNAQNPNNPPKIIQ